MIGITLSSGMPLPFTAGDARKHKGVRLPGAELFIGETSQISILVHEYSQGLIHLSLRQFQPSSDRRLSISEQEETLRFEMLVQGEIYIQSEPGKPQVMQSGQYRIADESRYLLHVKSTAATRWLCIYLPATLLSQMQLPEKLKPGIVGFMTNRMVELVEQILENPYDETLRSIFLDCSIRELLLQHFLRRGFGNPGDLSPAVIQAVREADAIISEDLSIHHNIETLARMVHTNSLVLKTGFSKLFGMGVFQRLHHKRMEKAKNYLANSDLQIQEIAHIAGYETVTGFVNSFRKEFKLTPRQWRKKSRGE